MAERKNKIKSKERIRIEQYKAKRLRLQKNISYYRTHGVDVSFMQLPEMPKKITRKAEKELERAEIEWKYYKGKKLSYEELKKIPDVSRAGERNIKEQMERATHRVPEPEPEQEPEETPKPEPPHGGDYPPGDEWDDWNDDTVPPSPDENLAIILYEIATQAWQDAVTMIMDGVPMGYHKAPPDVVKMRAEHVMQAYTDIGMMDDEKRKEFSRKLLESGQFQEIARDLEQGLWDSDSEAYKDPLDRSLGIMQMKDPELSEKQRMHAGNID